MRLRLHFDRAFGLAEYSKALVAIPANLETVGDLLHHLTGTFGLRAKRGVILLLGDFAIPPAEVLDEVLRDNDEICVRSAGGVARSAPQPSAPSKKSRVVG